MDFSPVQWLYEVLQQAGLGIHVDQGDGQKNSEQHFFPVDSRGRRVWFGSGT